MTDQPAIIAGQLVNMRNVGVHKSVALTIHVPQEYALRVTEMFGWPTMTDPVPVALARMEVMPAESRSPTDTAPDPVSVAPGRARKAWDELSPAQQAGVLCADPSFESFLREKLLAWHSGDAACTVRAYCGVRSRTELNTSPAKADLWRHLVANYRAWRREPEVVG